MKKDRYDPNSQDPDEPGHQYVTAEGLHLRGKGAMGGGSKKQESAFRAMNMGSGRLHGSAPASKQKIRG